MRRDDDLIRKILFAIEETPAGSYWNSRSGDFSELDFAIVRGHIDLLVDCDFIDKVERARGASQVGRLTSAGHDYHDNIRDETRWKTPIGVAKKSGGFGLGVMQQTAAAMAAQAAMSGINGGSS